MVAPREMTPMDLHPDDPRTLAARISVLEELVESMLEPGIAKAAAEDVDIVERDRVGRWGERVLTFWKERQSR